MTPALYEARLRYQAAATLRARALAQRTATQGMLDAAIRQGTPRAIYLAHLAVCEAARALADLDTHFTAREAAVTAALRADRIHL